MYDFIIAPEVYRAFADESEQLEQCKMWGLLSEKASKTKAFLYKGHGRSLTCSIVGLVDPITAVIEFEGGERHCIHPSYLKEMQASSFGVKPAAAGEQPAEDGVAETEAAAETGLKSEAETETSAETGSKAGAETETGATGAATSAAEAAEEAGAADGAANAEAEKAATADVPAKPDKPAAEAQSKGKGKKEKLVLPEDKVKMMATVMEFTTVPNHFSDTDDEVIIYEAVSILEPEMELGSAWSSNSATLKKLELAVGDTITFEAKVAAKKLTKHPVPYKINNPSKIQKQS